MYSFNKGFMQKPYRSSGSVSMQKPNLRLKPKKSAGYSIHSQLMIASPAAETEIMRANWLLFVPTFCNGISRQLIISFAVLPAGLVVKQVQAAEPYSAKLFLITER